MIFWEKIRQRKKIASAGVVLLIVFSVGIGSSLWPFNGNDISKAAESRGLESTAPKLVRKGDQIVVPEGSPMRSQIIVQAVEVQEIPRTLVVPATVEADPSRTVNVLPPVTGKIVDLKVNLGDYVTKGQLLVVLASGDFAQADTDLNKSRDVLQLSKRGLERARSVFEAGGSARKDVEQAESNYLQALEEYQRAESRLKAIGGTAHLGSQTHLLTLIAPVSGNVTALSTAPGAFVNDATAPLMTIANLDSIWFTASVPESSVWFVTKGQKVDVTLPAYPGEVFNGTVTFVSAVLDPETRSDKVRITFANRNGKFKPNMFASVSFTIPQERQIFVENSALLMNNDRTTVFIESEPWTFVRRAIELGNEEGKKALIRKGLNQGDRIIVSGGVLLND